MKPHASFISFSLNWLLNSLSKNYICIKIWPAPEKLSQFLASCSRLTIQTLWNAETISFPSYSHPNLIFKFRFPLSLGHVILFGRLRLDLGITSRIEDFLFHQRAESISLWYSQSSYSLIEIIIVSGHHIQEIEPWRLRLKTIYAPCYSRGADMVLLVTGNGLIASCGVKMLWSLQFTEVD